MPDQQRHDWLSCAGHPYALTPCIDQLAAHGVRFAHAYTPAPLCGPARMALLSGRHPWRQEVWINEDCLDSNTPCFTHGLGRAGYHCVLAGRMHFMGPDQRHGYHERVGSDFCRTYPGGPGTALGPDLRGSASSSKRSLECAGVGGNPVLDYDEHVTLAAEQFLHQRACSGDQQPLLLTVGWYGPHNPYRCDQALYDAVCADQPADDAPFLLSTDDMAVPWIQQWHQRQKTAHGFASEIAIARRCYAAMVREIDAHCARVLARARRLPGPTIVVYLSDHGDMMGDHGLMAKGCFYEGSLGVPLIVAPLNESGAAYLGAQPGSVITAPVSLLDVAPTLIAWGMTPEQQAEAAPAADRTIDNPFARTYPIPLPDIDGDDLTPLIREPTLAATPGWAERPVFSEINLSVGPARAVIRGGWKYVYYHESGEQLFDLVADPGEQRNLASVHTARTDALKALVLQDWDAERCLESSRRKMRDFGYMREWGQAGGFGPEEVFQPGMH